MINTLPPDADARHKWLCLPDDVRAERAKMAAWVAKDTEQDGVAVDGNDGDYSTSAFPRPGKPTDPPTPADEAASDLLQQLASGEEIDPEVLEQLVAVISEAYTQGQVVAIVIQAALDADESAVDPQVAADLHSILYPQPAPKKYWSNRLAAKYLARLAR